MALPVNIDDLIHQRKVERTRIEYKKDWNPEPIIHSLTAFANDYDNMGGGYILIGVEEKNGRPILPLTGLNSDALDKLQQLIINKCNYIEPRYIPVIEPCTIDGKDILVLWAPGGEDRPYKCPEKVYAEKGKNKGSKAYYIRKGARTLKANVREERELISMARDIPFDDRINYHAAIEDMKSALLADYLHTVKSDLYTTALDRPLEDLATDMHLVRGPSEYRKPVNVGLLFFNERPDQFFPYTRIEVIDKPDPTGINMTEKIFTGPLDKQLREALSYINNYIIKEHVTKVSDSELAVRSFNWPFQAVEEALSNAVYHRSYQLHEPITVTITPEKMEILSIPGPDPSISDDNLRSRILVSKRYRNRRIGDFLKELEIVEGRNTGVPLIIRAMQNNGSGLPEFETDSERTYFQVTLPIHPVFLSNVSSGVQGKSKGIRTQENATTKNGERRSRDEVKSLVLAVLENNGDLSRNEIAVALGYKKVSNSLRKSINELLDEGRVSLLNPEKPTSRNQKILLVK